MRTPTIFLILLTGLTPILILSLLVFGSSLSLVAWQPPNIWSRQFGLPQEPNLTSVHNSVSSVFARSDSLYAGGSVGYYPDSGNSAAGRLFVTRYDLTGDELWTRQFGDPAVSEILAVAAGSGGVGVAGSLSGQGFVRYYYSNGTEAWTAGSNQSQVHDVSVGKSAVYTAGYNYFASNISYVGILQSHDFNGSLIWSNNLSPGPLYVKLYVGPDGIYLSRPGTLQLYDLNGTLLWSRQPDCPSCETTSIAGDGTSVYLAGYVNPVGQNLYFLGSYDSSGNKVWTRQFRTEPSGGSAIGVSTDSSGIYMVIAGLSGGGSIVKYDSQGNHVWSLTVKPTLYAVSVLGGGVYVGGTTKNAGGSAFLAEYGQSSSLVLFGLNPPFSFGLLAVLLAVCVVAIWQLRKHYEIKAKSYSPGSPVLKSKGVPGDAVRLIHHY